MAVNIDVTLSFPNAVIPLLREVWPSTTNEELKNKLSKEFMAYVFVRLKDRRKEVAAREARIQSDQEITDIFRN